jgi:uncharacterized membrane protein (DUF2068 family)
VLVLLASAVLGIAGLLGIFASPLGLIPGSGLNAGALLSGGVLFLVLGIVLGVSGTGLMKLRPWAWWLAVLTVLAVLIWTVYRIVEAIGFVHLEWYATAGLAAVLFGYLLTVRRFFQRPGAG